MFEDEKKVRGESPINMCGPGRETSPHEIIAQRVDALRREANDLETLGLCLPQVMDPAATRVLRHLLLAPRP